jgi:hypothetical protein
MGTKIKLDTERAGLSYFLKAPLEFPEKCISCCNPVIPEERLSLKGQSSSDFSIKVPFCKACQKRRKIGYFAPILGGILSIILSVFVLLLVVDIIGIFIPEELPRGGFDTGIPFLDSLFLLPYLFENSTFPYLHQVFNCTMYLIGMGDQYINICPDLSRLDGIFWGILILFWFFPWWGFGTKLLLDLIINERIEQALNCAEKSFDWLMIRNEDYAKEVQGGLERKKY